MPFILHFILLNVFRQSLNGAFPRKADKATNSLFFVFRGVTAPKLYT